MKNKIRSISYLINLYIAAVPRLVSALCVQPFFYPRYTRRMLNEFLGAVDFSFPDHVLRSKPVEELFPCSPPPEITLSGSFSGSYYGGTRKLSELTCLAYLMRKLAPARVLEIGTFKGRTTRLLAANAGDNAHIWTIDLPAAQCAHSVGEFYRDTPYAGRITQLNGDTLTYNFDKYAKQMDFVWVDACHDYPFVVNDTEVALRCSKSGAWIAWHDYRHTAYWSGVTKRVRELSSDRRLMNLSHVLGTSIVVAQVR